MSVFSTEYIYPNSQHTALFYEVASLSFPLWMVVAAAPPACAGPPPARRDLHRVTLAMVWILPLFPAQAKLAPIYNPVTHMVPPAFPILLIIQRSEST